MSDPILIDVIVEKPPTIVQVGQLYGIPGDKGDTGAQGPTGVQGDKGDKGDKGDQGDQGIQGIQGIQGVKGDKGDKGDTGDKGDPGLGNATILNGTAPPANPDGVPGDYFVDYAGAAFYGPKQGDGSWPHASMPEAPQDGNPYVRLNAGWVAPPPPTAGSITGAMLADRSVPGVKLQLKTVTGQEIADASIANSMLLDTCVHTNNLQDGSVTKLKIAVGAVDYTRFSGQLLQLAGLVGSNREIEFFSSAAVPPPAAAQRWTLTVNSAAETGANVGSDFGISRYNDAGAYLGTPLLIARSTGNVTIAQALTVNGFITCSAGGAFTGSLSINQANQQYRVLYFTTNNTGRWAILADNSNEAGGNAGSNFAIYSYNDAGGNLSVPFTITRSSGLVTIANSLNVNGAFNTNGAISLNPPAGNDAFIGMNKGGSGHTNLIKAYTSGGPRWDLHVGDTTAESGGNAGSDFALWSYADGGGVIGNPFKIIRSSGQTVLGALQVNGAIGCNAQGVFTGNLTAAINGGIAANCVMVGYFSSGAWFNMQSVGVNVNAAGVTAGYGSGGSVNWSCSASDRRLKDKIKKPKLDALAIVKALPIWQCDYIAPRPKDKDLDDPKAWPKVREHWPFSFMADEVDAALPYATIKDAEGVAVALHPSHLIATLWAAVQQLEARVRELEGV